MRTKDRIAIICGGSSSERSVSLDSGRQIFSAIDKSKYDVVMYDTIADIPELVRNAVKIDFAFVALHGIHGEDGTVQGLLDLLGIPYQGSGVLGSAIAMNKIVSKRLFEHAGLPVAPYIAEGVSDLICGNYDAYVERKLGFPVVVKPAGAGSSVGISIIKRKEDLASAISHVSKYDNYALVEAYIEGVEITCAILGNDTLEALPLVEIVHDGPHEYFDYEAKYSNGVTQEICPARINDSLTRKAQLYARAAHGTLFCRGYSRTDMILKNDDFYILETNTIPGMTADSLYPKSALSIGMSFKDLLGRLITLGMEDACRG